MPASAASVSRMLLRPKARAFSAMRACGTNSGVFCYLALYAEIVCAAVYLGLGVGGLQSHVAYKKLGFPAVYFTQQTLKLYACGFALP